MTSDTDFAFIEIGYKGDLTIENATRAAGTIIRMHLEEPQAMITAMIGGFDNDPRELWDIDEPKQYIAAVARILVRCGYKVDDFKLHDDTIACFAMCCGVGKITATHERGYTVEINPP
jgi:hypothetical protein